MNNTNLRLSIHPPESNLWIQWCLGTYHLSVGSQEMIWTLGGQFHNVPLIFGSNEINEFVAKYAHSKAHLLFALPEMGLWSYKEKVGRFNQHLDFFGITNYSSSSKSFCCLQFFDAQLSSAIEIYRTLAWLQLFPMQSGSISTILLPECMSANYCEVFIDVQIWI